MARILLIGGTGLIGREFVQQALARGDALTLVGRQSQAMPGVEFVQADLCDLDGLLQRLPSMPFDAVVYLAQADSHQVFPAGAQLAVAVNLAAPVALCQWAVQHGCRQFVYASSGGVCGPGAPGRLITEDLPRQGSPALTFYLSTKARCEELLESFAGNIQLDLLRYFFVYGPQQKDAFLFRRLVRRVAAGETVDLPAGTGPTLNPIHAQDAARLTREVVGSAGACITNIAGRERVLLVDVVRRLALHLGVEARIRATAEPAASYLASIDRMQSRLGSPSLTLEDGVQQLAAALRDKA